MLRKHLTVGDLMTRNVIALQRTDSLRMLRDVMDVAEIRHVPIVDGDGKVVGIVSSHDWHRALRLRRGARRVDDVMTHEVITLRADAPASEAIAIFIASKIGGLPVVDRDGKLLGIITATDFLAVAHQALSGVEPSEVARA